MSSEWGKGSASNQIGWGQAAGNATNGYGESQKVSYAGFTDIVGLTTLNILYSSANYCSSAANPTPTVSNNAGAGVFSSTSGLVFVDTATGEINIASSTAGNYVITYTDTDAATATFSLSLNAAPSVTVSVSSGTICVGESTTITASGATSYVWSDGQTTNPITVSPTTTTNFTATGTDSNGCTGAGTTQITVNAVDSAAFSYAASVYCANGTDPTPTITGTSGGAFTSTTGLVINSGTGAINLDTSTVGAYSITYTTTGVCPANQSVNLTINAADNAAFSYSASSYAPTDADPTPTITGLTGGTFSGSTGLVINSTTGEIDLSASTVAAHTITYNTTSSGSSVCPNTSTQNVDIALAGISNVYSMTFDGVNDYINVGNDSSLDISGNLTISAWVKINDYNDYHGVVSKIDSSTRNYEILIRPATPTGGISFYVANTTFITSTGTVPLNTWTHIVVAVESGVTNGAKIYINGSEDSTTGTLTINSNTANLNIGRRTTGSFYVDGQIDEVAIWDTALTDSQVAQIYNATSTGKTADLSTISGSNLKYFNRMGD
tara:strand:+ start:2154 stop:3809 length:1656 start_codon:yes stop_codon:yes gene_type:complete